MTVVHELSGGLHEADGYLLEGEGGVAAVDPGMDGSKVVRRLEEEGLSLDYVLLTHVHFDHSASAAALREETGAEVCVHAAEAEALESGGELTLNRMFDSAPRPCPVDRVLEEGDEVVGTEVVHVPGHSPGSVCYLFERGGLQEAFVGDLVFPGGSFGRTDLPMGSGEELAESLDRVAGLGLDGYYCGHGGRGDGGDVEKAAKMARVL